MLTCLRSYLHTHTYVYTHTQMAVSINRGPLDRFKYTMILIMGTPKKRSLSFVHTQIHILFLYSLGARGFTQSHPLRQISGRMPGSLEPETVTVFDVLTRRCHVTRTRYYRTQLLLSGSHHIYTHNMSLRRHKYTQQILIPGDSNVVPIPI